MDRYSQQKRTIAFPVVDQLNSQKRATFLADEGHAKNSGRKKRVHQSNQDSCEELDDVREGAFDSTGTLGEYIDFYIDADRGLQNYIKADAAIKDFFKIKSDHPYFTEPTLGMLTADIQAIRKRGTLAKVQEKDSVDNPIKGSALVGDPT